MSITKEDLHELASSIIVQVDASIARLDAKLDASVGGFDAKLDASVARLDASVARLDAKLDTSVARLDARIDENTTALGKLTEKVDKNGVLLEQLADKVQVAFEGITSAHEQFERSLAGTEQRLGERITLLEEVVREHSGEVAGLREEIAELRRRFDRRDDWAALERRVTELESRLGRR